MTSKTNLRAFSKVLFFSTCSNCLKMCMVVFCQKTAEFCWEIFGTTHFWCQDSKKKTYPFLPLFNGNLSLRNCKCRFFRTTFATGMHIMFWSWNFQRVRYKLNLDGGFKYFLCSPRKLGKMNPFWRANFSKRLIQPWTRNGSVKQDDPSKDMIHMIFWYTRGNPFFWVVLPGNHKITTCDMKPRMVWPKCSLACKMDTKRKVFNWTCLKGYVCHRGQAYSITIAQRDQELCFKSPQKTDV